jgi:hypothetical protein
MDTAVATAARRLLLLDHASHRDRGAPSPRPDPPPHASFPELLPVFILFALLLCFLSIFLLRDLLHFFSLWLRRRRRLRDANAASSSEDAAVLDAPHKAAGLDPKVLAAFPTVRFEEATSSSLDCAVCLSEFDAGDVVRLLTVCRHAFHVACIDSWLAAHTTCPLCRCELDARQRAPGHVAAVHRERDGGRVAIVVDSGGAGAALASSDSGGAWSQFDR